MTLIGMSFICPLLSSISTLKLPRHAQFALKIVSPPPTIGNACVAVWPLPLRAITGMAVGVGVGVPRGVADWLVGAWVGFVEPVLPPWEAIPMMMNRRRIPPQPMPMLRSACPFLGAGVGAGAGAPISCAPP